MRSETDVREGAIDGGAAFLLSGSPDLTEQDWRQMAGIARSWAARDIYSRCAEILKARGQLQAL